MIWLIISWFLCLVMVCYNLYRMSVGGSGYDIRYYGTSVTVWLVGFILCNGMLQLAGMIINASP